MSSRDDPYFKAFQAAHTAASNVERGLLRRIEDLERRIVALEAQAR